MNLNIAVLLLQDGLTNGAIYALLALAAVMVFAVTRVIMIPQGEFVSYAALTFASFQVGKVPATVGLVLLLGIGCAALDGFSALRDRKWQRLLYSVLANVAAPGAIAFLIWWWVPRNPGLFVQAALTFLILVPLGPMLYRLAFEKFAEASTLVLLIIAVAVHYTLAGLGLYIFGDEGVRSPPFVDAVFNVGGYRVSLQSLFVMGAAIVLVVALYLFFEATIRGRALRATAINRIGARLVGISATEAGRLAFTLSAAIGVASGILIASVTTVYYDTGFLLGLKGLIGAILGGMANYPLAAAGAVLLGLLDSYFSFLASQYKDVITFTFIIPILLWRSLRSPHLLGDGSMG
jgi:branched-chain amino acid transport system permease protein